jgi:hypothetical protein
MPTQISEQKELLSSWKEIAKCVGKGVRTVQRWEKDLGLPVRRLAGRTQKSTVLLYRSDLDAWMATRFTSRAVDSSNRAGALKQTVRTAEELNRTNRVLVEQIAEAAHDIATSCGPLINLKVEVFWCVTPVQSLDSLASRKATIPTAQYFGGLDAPE